MAIFGPATRNPKIENPIEIRHLRGPWGPKTWFWAPGRRLGTASGFWPGTAFGGIFNRKIATKSAKISMSDFRPEIDFQGSRAHFFGVPMEKSGHCWPKPGPNGPFPAGRRHFFGRKSGRPTWSKTVGNEVFRPKTTFSGTKRHFPAPAGPAGRPRSGRPKAVSARPDSRRALIFKLTRGYK